MGAVPTRGNGDDEFAALYDELFPRAFRVAYRVLGNRAEAEEAANEALTRALADWGRVRTLPWRNGWVLRVASNVAIDVVRRRRPVSAAAPVVGSHSEAAAIREALQVALLALPARQREVVSLFYLSDLSEAEVAHTLGISAGAVKRHLHRAREALRARLGDAFALAAP